MNMQKQNIIETYTPSLTFFKLLDAILQWLNALSIYNKWVLNKKTIFSIQLQCDGSKNTLPVSDSG